MLQVIQVLEARSQVQTVRMVQEQVLALAPEQALEQVPVTQVVQEQEQEQEQGQGQVLVREQVIQEILPEHVINIIEIGTKLLTVM